MPFLFYEKNQFTFIEERVRQGLIIQHYTKQGLSRPLPLFPPPFNEYDCILTSENHYSTVVKNAKNQVYHIEYNGKETTRSLLLEDQKKLYEFSCPRLGSLNQDLHFFYFAKSSETTSLIHQKLTDPPSLDTLVPKITSPTTLKVYPHNGALYIFYTEKQEHFHLQCLKLSHTLESFTLLTTATPISDFSICFEENFIHIVYTKELYGKQQVVYTNTRHFVPLGIALVQGDSKPSLMFCEQNLWVSYTDGEILYHMLSLDDGSSFTKPIQSSIKEPCVVYDFIHHHPSINTHQVYVCTYPTLKLLPLYQIDTYGIHPDLSPNTPLELLLRTMKNHSPTPLSAHSMPANTPSYPPSPSNIASNNASFSESHPSQIPHPELPAPSVKEAAKSFMNNFNQFDALPLDRQ